MVGTGLQSKEIAWMRATSTATVSRHRERLRHKRAQRRKKGLGHRAGRTPGVSHAARF